MIVELTRIRPASRYHVRLAAMSGAGTVFGAARAFVTLPLGRVPEGVTVGRTYLGRMRRAAALSLLRQSAAAPLTFSYAGTRWRVSPSTVGVRTNAVRRVDEALKAAPGQTLPALRLSLDGPKLRAYVAGLSRHWAHTAMDETVRLAGTRAIITAAAPAVKVNTGRMISLVRASVLSGKHRPLPLAVVRGAAPASGVPKAVVVRLGDQTLTAYLDGKPILTTPVTTGRPALPTPIGSYSIKYRASPYVFTSPWAPGSPYWYPPTPVTWAMYFYDNDFLHDDPGEPSGAYGAGSQYGPYASHGCVHVPHSAMAFLYQWLPVGAPVIVAQT
jgi:lipoprotein-anchoring transpeptidase ErfK/SrfK